MAFDSVFDRSIPELQELQHGERLPIDFDKMNNQIKALKTITRGVAPARQIVRVPIRPIVPKDARRAIITGGVPSTGDKLRVKFDPTLNDDTEDEFDVSLPWELRKTPFAGETRNGLLYEYDGGTKRTVTDTNDDDKETEEEILPTYFVDDYLMIAKRDPAKVGLEEDEPEWEDANAGGRRWMSPHEVGASIRRVRYISASGVDGFFGALSPLLEDEGPEDLSVFVAKGSALRRAPSDNEEIRPEWKSGEFHYVTPIDPDPLGLADKFKWMDLNVAGRTWHPTGDMILPVRQVTLQEILSDTLLVKFDPVFPEQGDAEHEFAVWKPYVLQKTRFDTGTHDGISYQYSTSTRRIATEVDTEETEQQLVVPRYKTNGVLLISRGTDNPANPAEWMDINVDARMWAAEGPRYENPEG